mgnify:FL=1
MVAKYNDRKLCVDKSVLIICITGDELTTLINDREHSLTEIVNYFYLLGTWHFCDEISNEFFPPSLGHAVNNLRVLIARKAQVYKIFPIETLCGFLKKCNLLAVVFDQIVILL